MVAQTHERFAFRLGDLHIANVGVVLRCGIEGTSAVGAEAGGSVTAQWFGWREVTALAVVVQAIGLVELRVVVIHS